MSEKINVLQLVEGFSLGGAEKKLLELVKHMDRTRFQTTVCSLGMGREIEEDFFKLRDMGIDVVVIPRKRYLDLRMFAGLMKLIKERNIDVIMTTLFYADVIGAVAGRFSKGVKSVYSWETISAPEWLWFRRLMLYKLVSRWDEKIVAVSQATSDFQVDERGVPPEKMMIIPYGVDLKAFKASDGKAKRAELGIGETDPVIGMVGRLHPQKGHCYLIDAAEKVVKKHPNARFVLVGDGDLRQELKDRVASRNLEENVLFLGFRHDVPQLLSVFDIFTLPSLYEGLPNVVLEAMAASLPVVATPVDGTKEAVKDGETGHLVPVKDPQALAVALLDFLDQPEKAVQWGERGRKRVEDHFSLEGQVKQFEDLYVSGYEKGRQKK